MAGRKKVTRREKSAANKAAHAAARLAVPLGGGFDDFDLPACPWVSGEGPNEQVIGIILDTIAETGASLHSFRRKDPSYPSAATLCHWMTADPELEKRYARAAEVGAAAEAEEARRVACGLHRPEHERDEQGAVQRDRLTVDQIKWDVGKKAPKKYGDRVKLEHEGEIKTSVKLDLTGLSEEQLETALAIAQQVRVEET